MGGIKCGRGRTCKEIQSLNVFHPGNVPQRRPSLRQDSLLRGKASSGNQEASAARQGGGTQCNETNTKRYFKLGVCEVVVLISSC